MEYEDVSKPDDFAVLTDFVEDVDQSGPDLTEPVSAAGSPAPVATSQEPAALIATETLGRLVDEFTELRGTTEKGFALFERQSDLVDRLHTENERLRRGEFDRMLDPIIRDLVALTDSCLRNADAWLARPATSPADLHRVLGDVASDISLVLERHGVETFLPAPGEPFDRKQQRAARTEPTQQPELNGRIARSLRPGYRSGARTIRFAEVVVLSYSPDVPASPRPEQDPPADSGPAGGPA